MKKYIFAIVLLIAAASPAIASPGETNTASKAEVSKLAFLAGKWAGKGGIMGRDRQKTGFDQTEDIKFKQDNSLLLIEGRGMAGGKVTHNALAIVSWDKEKGHYTFRSYLVDGRQSDFKAELMGEIFLWYPNENTRYIIYLNEKGQWYETGEFMRGGEWFQFFEMTLDKL